MVKVGVIGLGMMGLTHLEAYSKRDDVVVAAIADQDSKRLSGESLAEGNLDGLAKGGFDYTSVKKYTNAMDLIEDTEIDLVDICLPTPLHKLFMEAAVQAGKHVLIEKPLARTSTDAFEMVRLSEQSNQVIMPAMCMRFWPGWDWLKNAIDNGTYGKVLSANFRRLGQQPAGAFYENGDLNGGGLLDIHIHDTDFIHHCFGMPKAVYSQGYCSRTNEVDHVITQYIYDEIPLVVAEGGWWPIDNCPFVMTFTVTFEKAVAYFDIADGNNIRLVEQGAEPHVLEMSNDMGYDGEIAYMIECIQSKKKPVRVTMLQAANTMLISEAERLSVRTGQLALVNPSK
ncbi:Gfo/Idh/MocA family protein [Poriferisphaera sp. WC338]|uniref:Gfo/Idh/MocA family protein n=1 Tax=Poriferisphaera sp. WC338 TaxID=3425129 RepID=UPI003D8139A5